MKKIILLFTGIIILTSCSKPDSYNATPDNILLKKTIETLGDIIITKNFTYDGNKLVSIIGDNSFEEKFTYTGDLITKREAFGNNQLAERTIYEYNSNKLVMSKTTQTGYTTINKMVYVYNTNGTISFSDYYIENLAAQEQLRSNGTIYFTNGEVSRVDNIRTQPDITLKFSFIYAYDSKNNPHRNIIGLNKIFLQGYNNHNITTQVTEHQIPLKSSSTIKTEYIYNAENYPVTGTLSLFYNHGSIDIGTIQYFY
jgi:hypothetical protein